MMRFEIYRQADAAGALATWTWRLQASNGEVIAAGTPEQVVQEQRSYTGHFLKELLDRRPAKKVEAAE